MTVNKRSNLKVHVLRKRDKKKKKRGKRLGEKAKGKRKRKMWKLEPKSIAKKGQRRERRGQI